jgi:hypothetical protein
MCPEDRSSSFSRTLVTTYHTTRRHNPEAYDMMNFHLSGDRTNASISVHSVLFRIQESRVHISPRRPTVLTEVSGILPQAFQAICRAKASNQATTASLYKVFISLAVLPELLIVSSASHSGDPGSMPDQVVWDLWWTEWLCG